MKKIHAAISAVFLLLALVMIQPVRAEDSGSGQKAHHRVLTNQRGHSAFLQSAVTGPEDLNSVTDVQIVAPTYPFGIDSGETKLVEYSVKETGNISGHITSRTLQFFTQYDEPLSEPMGPFAADVEFGGTDKTSWNEMVYLPKSIVETVRSTNNYALILKTTFTGRTTDGTSFTTEARLLLLLPPAAFSKSGPANGAIVQPGQARLKWNGSVGAVEYQYCIDRINNNSCDTDWTGTYWLGTYETNALLKNLLPDEVYYWQVRAVNSAGVTYANGGKFWKFTLQPTPPYLLSPIKGEQTDSLRPLFSWSQYYSALSYNIQISRNNAFSQVVVNATTLSESYTPNVDLAANSTLYWRVRFRNANGYTLWSNPQSFVTPNPPSIPFLSSPGANMLVTNDHPTFNWADSKAPAGSPPFWIYEIQIAQDSEFASIAIDGATTEYDITDSDFTPVDALAPNAKYFWRVRALNENGQSSSWSVARSFRRAMLPPILISPFDSEQLDQKRPTLDWEDVEGATGYRFIISKYPNLSNPIRSLATVGSFAALTTDLPGNTHLYWRVQATGPNGPSLWSETWSFTTGNPPSIPKLISPASNSLVTDYTPYLNWGNSSVPAGIAFMTYNVQVDNDRDFSSPEVDAFTVYDDITVSDYTPDYDLESNSRYYWRVRAYNFDMQYSAWSSVLSFRTSLLPPEPINVTIDSDPLKLRKPIFDWMQIEGASSYTIQASTSPSFGTLLINAVTVTPTYTSFINLPVNKTIYVRVRTNGINGPSRWAILEFQILQ